MGFDVFLEILRPLEGLATEIAFVRLERHVNADVRSDMVALDSSSAASTPCAGQIEVISTLPPNVAFAHMVLKILSATDMRAQDWLWCLTYRASALSHRSPHPCHWQVRLSIVELGVAEMDC